MNTLDQMPDPKTCTLGELAKWAKETSWAEYMYEYDIALKDSVVPEEKGWNTVQRGRGRGRGRRGRGNRNKY